MLQEAFNKYAQQYDNHFTNTLIGKAQRNKVYEYLKNLHFFSTKKVLEINCGTGEDAFILAQHNAQVTATDISEQMIEVAKQKNRDTSADFICSSIQNLPIKLNDKKFDIIFSNFGGLNCLNETDLKQFAKNSADLTSAQADLIFIIMGTNCLIEKLYFLLKGNKKKAYRRQQKNGVETNINNQLFTTYYYSPKQITEIFKTHYTVQTVKPIGLFIPPSYLEPLIKKHTILFKFLVILDGVFSKFSMLSNNADHYIIHLKKLRKFSL